MSTVVSHILHRSVAAALLVLALAAITRADDGATVTDILQEAFYHEVTLNDPVRAIELYDRVISTPRIEARDAAVAHLRKGICRHLQGHIEDAEREFRIILERFGNEAAAARIAARYLNVGSRWHPARFMPPDTLIYTELVDLSEQVDFLSELLRGTPLENPVDYYLSQAREARSSTTDLPRPRDQGLARLRAILNVGILREFQKIDGIALGFTAFSQDSVDFVGVFLPGSSDVSRGLIKALLTLAIDEITENVEGMPIFRLQQESPPVAGADTDESRFFLAMDSEEEVVFFGTSLELVKGSILRYRSRGVGPSLADLPDFRRALSARAGTSLFAYFQTEKLLGNIRSLVSEEELTDLTTVTTLLGLDSYRSTSVTFSRDGDALLLALRSRIAATSKVWNSLRTPVLDADILRFVPEEPLGFLAISVPGLPARLRRLLDITETGLPWITETIPADLKTLIASGEDRPTLSTSPTAATATGTEQPQIVQRVLAKLESLAVVQPRIDGRDPELSFYLIFGFAADARISEDFEKFLGFCFEAIFRNRASTEFTDAPETVTAEGQALTPRLLRPVPGLLSGYVRVPGARREPTRTGSPGQVFLVAPRFETIENLLRRNGAKRPGFSLSKVPAAGCKVFYLRPAEFVDNFGFRDRIDGNNPVQVILSRTPRLMVHTLESASGLSLELTIPEAAAVLRELIQSLPTQR